jgi:hypothetical protein
MESDFKNCRQIRKELFELIKESQNYIKYDSSKAEGFDNFQINVFNYFIEKVEYEFLPKMEAKRTMRGFDLVGYVRKLNDEDQQILFENGSDICRNLKNLFTYLQQAVNRQQLEEALEHDYFSEGSGFKGFFEIFYKSWLMKKYMPGSFEGLKNNFSDIGVRLYKALINKVLKMKEQALEEGNKENMLFQCLELLYQGKNAYPEQEVIDYLKKRGVVKFFTNKYSGQDYFTLYYLKILNDGEETFDKKKVDVVYGKEYIKAMLDEKADKGKRK